MYYRVKLNIDLNFFNSTEEYVPPNGYIAEIEHQMVQPKRTQIFDSHSVWQYQLLFHCHHGEGAEDPTLVGTPIVEEAQLRSIKQDLNQYLRKAVDLIRAFDLLELSNGVLGVSVGDPAQAVIPFIDGPPTLPPTTAPSVPPVNITFPTSAPTSTSQRMHEGRGKDTNGDGIVDEGSLTPGQNEKLGDGPYWEIRVQYWVR